MRVPFGEYFGGKRRASLGRRSQGSRLVGTVSRDVVERIKSDYFRLAYAQESIHVLEHHDQVLAAMQQIVESH